LRTFLLLTLVLGGCVGKRKYLDLEEAHAKTLADLDMTRAERDQRTDEVAELRTNIAEIERALAGARSDLAELDRQLQAERQQKSELLATRAQLNASIEEMTRALGELARRKAQAEESVAAFRDLLRRFHSLIDAGRLQVRIIDGRMVVQLATDVLFASGSASLSADGRQAIREVAAVLRDIPDRKFQVEGHTDDVPIRTERFPSNWELASARALTVVREMLDVGLPSDRVSAASYGEHAPVAPNRTPEGKSANRRIQIVVVPDLEGLPGYQELSAVSGRE
jgi:chemotaxis protein MotB